MQHKTPKEGEEQAWLFEWAAYQAGKYPELELMHHVPNGGSRNKAEAAKLKAQGVKPGVPDISLPVARGGYHGLYIELKRRRGGRVSAEQSGWIEKLNGQGYCAKELHGWEAAAECILWYLNLGEGKDDTRVLQRL